MSSLLFDEPLSETITQTILPVMSESGMMYGFIPIVKTDFVNPLTEVLLSDGISVMPRSVTLPDRPFNGTNMGVNKYVAIVYTLKEVSFKPWLGLVDLVSNNDQGYYSSYQMPAGALIHHFGLGTMLEALTTGMDTSIGVTVPTAPDIPSVASVAWRTTVNSEALTKSAFFDFCWTKLWNTTAPVNLRDAILNKLEVTANPVEGLFKAAVVQASVGTSVGPVFNTVRILRLAAVPPGVYVFKFNVFVGSTAHECVLTLTVV